MSYNSEPKSRPLAPLRNPSPLPYSGYQDIQRLFPLQALDKTASVVTRDMSNIIKGSVTRTGEMPYEHATVSFSSSSAEEVASKIHPTSTYLLEYNLHYLTYLDIELRCMGVDLFNLNNAVFIKPRPDDTGSYIPKEGILIGPPVVERQKDGSLI